MSDHPGHDPGPISTTRTTGWVVVVIGEVIDDVTSGRRRSVGDVNGDVIVLADNQPGQPWTLHTGP